MTACLVAAYTASPGTGASPASDAMTTCPRPTGRISSSAAKVPCMVPSALTSNISRRVSSVASHAGPVTSTPALLNHRSRPLPHSAVSVAALRQASGSRTSSAEPKTSAPVSSPISRAAFRGQHLVDVGDVHDVPAAGQPQRDLPAEAAAGPGDQRPAHDVASARSTARWAPRLRSRSRSHRKWSKSTSMVCRAEG